MSREHSRASSPLASPGSLSPPSSSFSPPTTSSYTSAGEALSAGSATASPIASSPNLLPENAARLAQSASPTNPSPLGVSTPRPTRPRAATTAATVSTSLLSRQEGFQPASRPATPTPLVMPVTASAPAPSASLSSNTTGTNDPPPVVVTLQPAKKASNPPGPLPASIAVTPPPPPSGLVEHLHRSLKTGACADVRIWVRQWGVGWHVHKMVLIQARKYQVRAANNDTDTQPAGFFHQLFMGGFSEGAPVRRTAKGKERAAPGPMPGGDDEWTGEDVELTFDDPNITRAAFE